MAKGKDTKKKNLKLRRQLRKTLGCLFMVSAIIVTTIPVTPAEAAVNDTPTKITVLNQTTGLEVWESAPSGVIGYNSKIPYVKTDATIYTTGDGKFHFAYMEPTKTSADEVAVILGYTNIGNLENNALTIPDTVDAYRKYTTNTTVGENCAVSRNNEFLFYQVTTKVNKTDPVTGEIIYKTKEEWIPTKDYNSSIHEILEGNLTDVALRVRTTDYSSPVTIDEISYKPCYYSTRSNWEGVFAEDGLYYLDTTDSAYKLASSEDHQRIHNAVVAYIGNQKVKAGPAATPTNPNPPEWVVGDYVTSDNPSGGVFAGHKNIVSLKVGKNLMGIGDYAFYNCTGLGTVTLGNGLDTIGNGAFAECKNMLTCIIDVNSNLDAIGHHAFYNCTGLTDFTVPTGLEALGDSSFENCRSLKTIDFDTGRNTLLKYIGDKVFNGCESLKSVSFPRDYTEELSIKLFDGCKGLKYITAKNTVVKFIDSETDIKAFLSTVAEDFYFEALDASPIHDITKKYEIAFKYLNEEIYEKVVIDGSTSGTTTWRVNNKNELIYFAQTGVVNDLVVPRRIGPYYIQRIGDRSFEGNCDLKKIIIPSSVTEIGNEAFLACHNLTDVIFEEPINLSSIGTDAFSTQKGVSTHTANCIANNTNKLTDNPKLTFTGKIDNNSLPFKYAMTPTTKINYGTQPETWITFYSGWPSNLTVRYNPKTDKNELIDYPLYDELKTYTINSFPYMTATYVTEASTAVSVYEAYNADPTNKQPSEYQMGIVNSALNIVLPAGIESIQSGLFSGKDVSGTKIGDPNLKVKSITTNTIDELPAYGFADCTGLESFYMGGGTSVGDYAFDNDTGLRNVEIASSVTALGKRPFRGCIASSKKEGLTSVSFPGSDSFTSANGIIYGKTNGVNTKVIECLETRGKVVGATMVGPEELANVKEIASEAFMGCDYIGEVNLGTSSLVSVGEKAFAETDSLYKVTLPDTAKEISAGAFWNSFLKNIVVPSSVVRIAPDAFSNTTDNGKTFESYDDHDPLLIVCLDDSFAAYYAKDYSYITTKESDELKTKWSVMFFDALDEMNPVIIDEVRVLHGTDATPPTPPVHAGYTFAYWFPTDIYKAVTKNVEVYAKYTKNDATTYTVRFFNYNKELMNDYTQQVVEGKDAVPPAADKMVVEGKVFTGWDRSYSNITSAVDIYATYTDKIAGTYTVTFWADTEMTTMVGKPQQVAAGESAIEPAHPTKTGYTFSGWFPATAWQNVTKDLDVVAMFTSGSGTDDNGNNNGNNGNNNNGNNNGGNGSGGSGSGGSGSSSGNSVSGNSTKYTVTVSGGSGSGDYTPGTIVNINAYATADGQVFDKWTSSSAGVGFVNASAISTSFTMPANNVAITANQKAGKSSSSSVSGNARNTLRNSTTSVDVTKSGISNTDLVSANVNGSSDNYVIRITEDAQATAAVIAALEAKYGDLSNIAYWPMDISLYDETGQTKITDVSGVTVDITLPLPDELIQYAGNNKAASVVNSQLEELGAKFTTIDGVPCIQFTATHFSPYTIYVDKANLTEGLIDATPKTGDPIHPKWFLAIGLACVSVILFAKKDKVQPKVKTA